MRRITAIKFVLVFVIVCLVSLPNHAQSSQLPVLKVTFLGSFSANMDYIYGSMQLTDVDGSVLEMPAKFKTRGATAKQYSMKPSFNMKFRDAEDNELDANVLGLRTADSWILDAMAIDRICMRNRVCFDIWNEFSHLPYDTDFGSRSGTVGKFVEVYINDEYKGIYCLTDRINRKLLDLKKVKDNGDGTYTIRGVLYKHGTNDIGDQNTPGYSEDSVACVYEWHNAWEITYPDDYAGKQAWQPLFDKLAIIGNYNDVKKNFYLENIADYELLIMALCISDNWGNKNKYASIRNTTATDDRMRMVFTPWDLDTSLGGHSKGDYYDGTYETWSMQDIYNSALLPFSVCQAQSEYMSILKQRWAEGRAGAFSIVSVATKLRTYRDLFINSGAWQRMVDYYNTQKYKPCHVEDLSKEVELIINWYKNRFHEMDSYFGIAAPVLGDANADATVDVADITAIAAYILGDAPADFNLPNADANEDGTIDVADITTTASIILK